MEFLCDLIFYSWMLSIPLAIGIIIFLIKTHNWVRRLRRYYFGTKECSKNSHEATWYKILNKKSNEVVPGRTYDYKCPICKKKVVATVPLDFLPTSISFTSKRDERLEKIIMKTTEEKEVLLTEVERLRINNQKLLKEVETLRASDGTVIELANQIIEKKYKKRS